MEAEEEVPVFSHVLGPTGWMFGRFVLENPWRESNPCPQFTDDDAQKGM